MVKKSFANMKPTNTAGDLHVTKSAINERCRDVRAELETGRVRVRHLSLATGERKGFHRHVLDYFWTATSKGRARSHHADG